MTPAADTAAEISLRLGDILPRIPTQFLKPGPHDAQRAVRFPIAGLMEGISRGRPAVPLQQIAALCPDIFREELALAEEVEVPLPLQKLVEQIAVFSSAIPSRPSSEPRAAKRPAPIVVPESRTEPRVPFSREKISLSLAAIFRLLPHQIIGRAPAPGEEMRVELPLRLIEGQLPSGHVEIALPDFLRALPRELAEQMNAEAGGSVWIPLDEIFQNLPEHHPYHLGAGEIPDEEANGAFEPLAFDEPIDGQSREETIAGALARLPGMIACAVFGKENVACAGEFPGGIDAELWRGNVANLTAAAAALGGRETLSLQCENGFLTVCANGDAFVVALHRERSLDASVYDALASAASRLA